MEWFDSLCGWIMSLLASLFALFGVSTVSEACRVVESPVAASEGSVAASDVASEAPMAASEAPSNM